MLFRSKQADKPRAVEVARKLAAMGFEIVATKGTAAAITAAGVACSVVNKVAEGRPHVVDMMKNGEINLIVNTVEETRTAVSDSRSIRTTALANRITYYTTMAGARAACAGLRHMAAPVPYDLQSLHAVLKPGDEDRSPKRGNSVIT